MVRTAGTAIKVAGGKSSKSSALSGRVSSSPSGPSRSSIGGNKLIHRPIPKWQKPINNFFMNADSPSPPNASDVDDEIPSNANGTSAEHMLEHEFRPELECTNFEECYDNQGDFAVPSTSAEGCERCEFVEHKDDKENQEPEDESSVSLLSQPSTSSKSPADVQTKQIVDELPVQTKPASQPKVTPRYALLEQFEKDNMLPGHQKSYRMAKP